MIDHLTLIVTDYGARCHGESGPRPHDPRYDGAFVLDPDGYGVEAVCHQG